MSKAERKAKRLKLGVVLGIVFVLILATTSMQIVHDDDGDLKLEMQTALAEYAGLAAEDSGFLEIIIYPTDGSPAVTYAENNTATLEAGALAYFDTDGWTGSIDSNTPFDIIVRVRGNASDMKNATMFKDSRCRVTLNVTGDWWVGSDISEYGTCVVTQNSSSDDFIWMNFYWNNGGSGYSIDDDGTLNFDAPWIEMKTS